MTTSHFQQIEQANQTATTLAHRGKGVELAATCLSCLRIATKRRSTSSSNGHVAPPAIDSKCPSRHRIARSSEASTWSTKAAGCTVARP